MMIRLFAMLSLALLLVSGCQQTTPSSSDASSTPAPADAVFVKLQLPGMT